MSNEALINRLTDEDNGVSMSDCESAAHIIADYDRLRAELADAPSVIDAVCDHASHSAQPDVLRRATEYAHDIVTWLHRDHYADNTTFEPFGDLLGLLSQIDNMICGWKEPQPAVPDDVALADDADLERIIEESDARWTEDMFHVHGGELMDMLRKAAALRARAVPDKIQEGDVDTKQESFPGAFVRGWNACRRAMLAASKEEKK